jgi:putative FmdB family regulatory protein
VPIYEYERQDGTRFEIRQSFHDAALTVCPDTGQPVRRLIQPAPVIFKGSGWYITDSRSSTNGAKSESSGETKTEATAETASETKAETKTEATAESTSTPAGAKKSDAAA